MTVLTCRHCAHTLSEHSATTDPSAKPAQGDISVCLYCGTLSQYLNGAFIAPELAELESWLRDPSVIEAVYVALQLRNSLKAREN